MTNYTNSQIVKIGLEQIDTLLQSITEDDLDYIDEQKERLSFLPEEQFANLKENYTEPVEKDRLLYTAFVSALETEYKTGFPEHIYSIDLKDGSIETDTNGRRINYTTEVLTPRTTSLLHYINNECNDLYIIFPPIKDIKRTIEKIIEERTREHQELIKENLHKFEEESELPFISDNPHEQRCPTITKLQQKHTQNALLDIAKDDLIPKDIYRLTITSRYKKDLENLINLFKERFPSHIQFENNERNLYDVPLSQNPRRYLDRKIIIKVTIPDSDRYFYVEMQFKQTNMFFAHIRSHGVYEQFRIQDAKYKTALETAQKKKGTTGYEEAKKRADSLKKQCEEKRELCVDIHKSAIHQSNMYVLNKITWTDKNADGLKGLHGRYKKNEKGQYGQSIKILKENYIVESYEPFDGATEFATTPSDYLNKSHYLKMIGSLPESFNELGKNAAATINKMWENLTSSDIKNFDRLTETAIKYQDIIREMQKEMQAKEKKANTKTIITSEGR